MYAFIGYGDSSTKNPLKGLPSRRIFPALNNRGISGEQLMIKGIVSNTFTIRH
jgi:hypothetical protein